MHSTMNYKAYIQYKIDKISKKNDIRVRFFFFFNSWVLTKSFNVNLCIDQT